MFTLIEGDKQWSGVFDTSDMTDMQVEKVGGVYIFFSKQGAYIYYRGAQDMFKILKDPVIAIIDSIIYFTRDGKTYSIDLLRK